MWSAALDAILTTLRYLAPATIITIFWGQQSFLFKILKHIDSAFRAIVFSSEEQKQAILQWLAEAGPVRVEHLDTVWRHGWILCGVLDAALPGACAGHPPTRLSMKHAQAIAEQYLGVEPVFSRQELESNDSLSKHQEWKLATYLDRIREAISKLTPTVTKPVLTRTSSEPTQCILDYVAKGSGLSAIQINNKAHFKIYPTAQQSLDPGEVTVLIRGPRDTYGMAVIPPILGKSQMIRQNILGLQSKQTYTENVLPVTQGAIYLRNYGKNDMNKTYYIPKTHYDIDIDVDSQADHVRISYTVKLEGKYIISIASRGQGIVGSPFTVTATNNIIDILEKNSFSLEDGEEIDIVDVQNDRKVVLRIVDFVTEKMLLKENGTLEKISDENAKILMALDKDNGMSSTNRETIRNVDEKPQNRDTFKNAALKILSMYRVCKVFNSLLIEKHLTYKNERIENHVCPRNPQDIPDIVNSTLTDINYTVPEMREKFIVPECITVSLKAEKSKASQNETVQNTTNEDQKFCTNILIESARPDTPDSLEIENPFCKDKGDVNISFEERTATSGYNPFLNEDFEENDAAAKQFSSRVVALEYGINNSQNEQPKDSPIKIVVDSLTPVSLSPSLISRNPFVEGDIIERPKSPVFKIISGEKVNRTESIFVDPKFELITEEELGNEFVNPFFTHQFQTSHFDQIPMTDFIVGAPVSLPPIIRSVTPDPELRSLIITRREDTEIHHSYNNNDTNEEFTGIDSKLMYPDSSYDKADTSKDSNEDNLTDSVYSLDSSLNETINNSKTSTISDNESIQNNATRYETPRKDIWDSAYVSIDDNNSSPDNNNNENPNLCNNQNFFHNQEIAGSNIGEIINIGPAEQEIWQTCGDLKYATNKLQDDMKPYKWEVKRPSFTPIIEESDRSISLVTQDTSMPRINAKHEEETNTVSVAFAELNDMYQEYFPHTEKNSTAFAEEVDNLGGIETKYKTQTKDTNVNSASELTDVKRHESYLEGTISEVQANVTESVSVSQILHNEQKHCDYINKTKLDAELGKNTYNNIVLEKKKYWDERIRELEAKALEVIVPKKRRISSKQLKHDSLSKRKGKQMIKNFLNVGDYSQVTSTNQVEEPPKNNLSQSARPVLTEDVLIEPIAPDEKLVTKWKRYWDDKLEEDQTQIEADHLQLSYKNKLPPLYLQENLTEKLVKEVNIKTPENQKKDEASKNSHHTPIKQELPEEIFKAFETSPKRFFGTSRKQILSKLDTFLGKPVDIDVSTTDVTMCHESGLVSSRISLFHNMSNTEELPSRRKMQSLHNICHTRESVKSLHSVPQKENPQKYVEIKGPKEQVCVKKIANGNITETMNCKTIENPQTAQLLNPDISEEICQIPVQQKSSTRQNEHSRKNTQSINEKHLSSRPKVEALRKKSFSKSEMDIFNKPSNDTIDDLDKYKSCVELPRINVKSFISLYESVSKSNDKFKPAKRVYRTSSTDSHKIYNNSINADAVSKRNNAVAQSNIFSSESTTPGDTPTNLWTGKTLETASNISLERISDSYESELSPNNSKEITYLSLSDIELEIVENRSINSKEPSSEREVKSEHIEYKNRFKLAKEFFQSLEEIREIKKPRELNECELLLHRQSIESLENEPIKERPQKRVKKNIKSHSMPSSEIAKAWNQLQDRQERCVSEECSTTKLVKISEKFNVDDLFADVTEGKLSRQGSLRGIPHKKAVLEAFRSMENVADTTVTSYEIVDSQLPDFSKDYVKNAQRYLNEYPYLPKTDPSKYHSRIDIKASGLISLKELKETKVRRNSVPDLRLNPNFAVDL